MTLHDVGAAFGRALAQRIGEQRYQLWFAQHTKLTWHDDRLVVGVPNRFFQEWLHGTFRDALLEAAYEAAARPMELHFVIDPQLFQAVREEQVQVKTRPDNPEPRPSPHALVRRRWRQLNSFVVGPSNRLAHAAALHLTERPDVVPNPTFFWGPPGVGKTHLLEGICSELRKSVGESAVLFVTAEEFANQFLLAMREQRMPAFRQQFRETQALFVDDVHFLARKRATQEELLHTFEALRRHDRLVALTGACHPSDLADCLPELRDRLVGGGVWAVESLDADSRRGLLQAKAAQLELPLSDEVIEFLAEGLRGNVRELEGALNHLQHQAHVHRRAVTLELVRSTLGHFLAAPVRPILLPDIAHALGMILDLDPRSLKQRSRVRGVSHPRMLAVYLARKHTAASYAEISQFFGSANHTTAIAAEKKVRAWLEQDASLVLGGRAWGVKELLRRIEGELQGAASR